MIATRQPRRLTTEQRLFLGCLLLYLLPVWAVSDIPSQDGPAHLQMAQAWREYDRPDRAVYREYYVRNNRPDPSWTTPVLLAGLLNVCQPSTAEKVLVGGYVLALPLAIRYALTAVHPAAGWLALLALPFVYNYPLHMGFYNFCYSLPLAFIMLGYWLRHRDRAGLRQLLVLAGLGLLVYFSHLLTLMVMVAVLGVLGVWSAGVGWRQRAEGRLAKLLWMQLGVPLAALLPSLLLAAVFVSRETAGRSVGTASWADPAAQLLGLSGLVSFQARERLIAIGVSAVILAAAILRSVGTARRKRWQREGGFLAVAAVSALICLAAPTRISGGSLIHDRLTLFPFLLLLLWIGAHPPAGLQKRLLQAAAAGLVVSALMAQTATYASLSPLLSEYRSIHGALQPNSTVLAFDLTDPGRGPDGQARAYRVRPFVHAAGRLAAERGLVDLTSHLPSAGFFPLRFRPGLDPWVHIAIDRGFELNPPRAELLAYSQRTGGHVDYVLVWRPRKTERGPALPDGIRQQLQAGFELIATSSPRGFLQAYRRKEP